MNIQILHSTGWSCSNEGEIVEANEQVFINGKRHWRKVKLLKMVGTFNLSGELSEMHSVKVALKNEAGIKEGYEGTVKRISRDYTEIKIEREYPQRNIIETINRKYKQLIGGNK